MRTISSVKWAAIAGAVVTGAGVSITAILGIGSNTAYAATPATTLAASEIATLQQSVQTALSNINPSLTGPARDGAIRQALAQVASSAAASCQAGEITEIASAATADGVSVPLLVSAILPASTNTCISGAEAAGDIALGAVSAGASGTVVAGAIIAVGAPAPAGNDSVGTGLGQAAAALYGTNPTAANQIAQAMANEGTQSMGQAFASAVTASGGPVELADAGVQNPNAIGETGGTNNGNGGTTQEGGPPVNGAANAVIPTCTGPSCT